MKHGMRDEILHVALLVVVLVIAYDATVMSNFLLFHVLTEVFAVVVGLGVFTVGYGGYSFHKIGGLAILGAAYVGIGSLDLMHTFAYRGMGIMIGDDTNMTVQFWLASRAFQSAAILLALMHGRQEIRRGWVLAGMVAILVLIAASVLYWGTFPLCVTRRGLTPFANTLGMFTVLMFGTSIVLMQIKRHYFDPRLYFLFTVSLIFATGSELAQVIWGHGNASITMIAESTAVSVR